MKILILNGSPRQESNTKYLANAFKDGAIKNGHEVDILDIAKMNISGCKACEYCHSENGKGICVIRDDMDKVNPLLHEADMVVIMSPIHYWSFSGQMQSLITRFYAKGKPLKATKYAMILSSGSDNVYDAVTSQYNDILEYINAENLGIYKFFGYNQQTKENYDIMYNFGKSI